MHEVEIFRLKDRLRFKWLILAVSLFMSGWIVLYSDSSKHFTKIGIIIFWLVIYSVITVVVKAFRSGGMYGGIGIIIVAGLVVFFSLDWLKKKNVSDVMAGTALFLICAIIPIIDIYRVVRLCKLKKLQKQFEENYTTSYSNMANTYSESYDFDKVFEEFKLITDEINHNFDTLVKYPQYRSELNQMAEEYDNINNRVSYIPYLLKEGRIPVPEIYNDFVNDCARLRAMQSAQRQMIDELLANPSTNDNKTDEYMFFKDCNDAESLQKRYRDLIKIYHPDQSNGSTDAFKQIQEEYETLKSNL